MEKKQMNNMSLELASLVVEGIQIAQQKQGLPPFNITVVDKESMLTAFHRQDGSLLGSLEVSQMKARSAALFRLTTRQIRGLAFGENGKPPQDPGMICIPGVLPVPGGVPIFSADGVLLGAVGVSGANDDDDEKCAQLGIEHAKSRFDLQ